MFTEGWAGSATLHVLRKLWLLTAAQHRVAAKRQRARHGRYEAEMTALGDSSVCAFDPDKQRY
jgi:hypothetical protein